MGERGALSFPLPTGEREKKQWLPGRSQEDEDGVRFVNRFYTLTGR
jgi:hypothetical protein